MEKNSAFCRFEFFETAEESCDRLDYHVCRRPDIGFYVGVVDEHPDRCDGPHHRSQRRLILISISLLLASNFELLDGGSNAGGLSKSPWQKQWPFVSICFGWVVWSAILAVNIHWLFSPGFLLVSFFVTAVTKERRLKIQYSQAQSDENENKLDDKLAPQTDLFQLDAPQLDVQLDEPSLDQLAIQQELDQELEYVTEDEIVEEAEDFPAEVIQQVTRIKNENGESMVAYVRQRFEAGQLLRRDPRALPPADELTADRQCDSNRRPGGYHENHACQQIWNSR